MSASGGYFGGSAPEPGNASATGPGAGRLSASAQGGPFTSDLSVAEFAVISQAGYEPLGFVMGTSIYHIGLQQSKWSVSQELTTLTQAMYNARELAMTRMQAEAAALGADGVVGVRIDEQMYAWGEHVLEFMAVGTAVRAVGQSAETSGGSGTAPGEPRPPFTSGVSGQELFTLACLGFRPVALVMGTCVYHVAHQGVMQSLRQAGANQEMMQFTQAVYDARELALTRMQAEAARDRATGVVGVNVRVSPYVWGEHATEFLALGTAISRIDGHPGRMVPPTVTLSLDR